MKKRKDRITPNVVSVSTARRQFGQIMRRAKNRHERFIIPHRGEPKAVIVGIEEFIAIVASDEEKLEAVLLARVKDSDDKVFNIEDVRERLAKRLSKGKNHRT